MNGEIRTMYEEDRREHTNVPRVNTAAYKAMRARDLLRRQRVMELVASGDLDTSEDSYHAAWIMNHGDTPEDARNAHTALRASVWLRTAMLRWART